MDAYSIIFFFFNDTATTEIYTLSLHDALPISPTDTVATVHKFIPLRFIKGRDRPINLTDCALGLLTKPNIMSNMIALIGKLKCVKNPKLGAHVKKVGETTELTEGTVTSVNASFIVVYEKIGRAHV